MNVTVYAEAVAALPVVAAAMTKIRDRIPNTGEEEVEFRIFANGAVVLYETGTADYWELWESDGEEYPDLSSAQALDLLAQGQNWLRLW